MNPDWLLNAGRGLNARRTRFALSGLVPATVVFLRVCGVTTYHAVLSGTLVVAAAVTVSTFFKFGTKRRIFYAGLGDIATEDSRDRKTQFHVLRRFELLEWALFGGTAVVALAHPWLMPFLVVLGGNAVAWAVTKRRISALCDSRTGTDIFAEHIARDKQSRRELWAKDAEPYSAASPVGWVLSLRSWLISAHGPVSNPTLLIVTALGALILQTATLAFAHPLRHFGANASARKTASANEKVTAPKSVETPELGVPTAVSSSVSKGTTLFSPTPLGVDKVLETTYERWCGTTLLPGELGPGWASASLTNLVLAPGAFGGVVDGCATDLRHLHGHPGFVYLISRDPGTHALMSVSVVDVDASKFPAAIFVGPAAEEALKLIRHNGPIGGSPRIVAGSGDLYLAYTKDGTIVLQRPRATAPDGNAARYTPLPDAIGEEFFSEIVSSHRWLWARRERNERGFERFVFRVAMGGPDLRTVLYDKVGHEALVELNGKLIPYHAEGRHLDASTLRFWASGCTAPDKPKVSDPTC